MSSEKEALINTLIILYNMNDEMKVSLSNTSLKVLKAFYEGTIENAKAYNSMQMRLSKYELID